MLDLEDPTGSCPPCDDLELGLVPPASTATALSRNGLFLEYLQGVMAALDRPRCPRARRTCRAHQGDRPRWPVRSVNSGSCRTREMFMVHAHVLRPMLSPGVRRERHHPPRPRWTPLSHRARLAGRSSCATCVPLTWARLSDLVVAHRALHRKLLAQDRWRHPHPRPLAPASTRRGA
jgi:hypothetical protein